MGGGRGKNLPVWNNRVEVNEKHSERAGAHVTCGLSLCHVSPTHQLSPAPLFYFLPSFQSQLLMTKSVWWKYEDRSYREMPKQSFSTMNRVKSILLKRKWGTTREWTAGAPEVCDKKATGRGRRRVGAITNAKTCFNLLKLPCQQTGLNPITPASSFSLLSSPGPQRKMLINWRLQIETNLSKEHRTIKLICLSLAQA